MLLSERLLRIGELTARNRVFVDHEVVVERDDDHDQGSDTHGDGRAERASLSEKRIPRHDKRTPADDAA